MLTAQYVIVAHLTGQTLSDERRRLIRHYLERQQADDGGWRMHDGSDSYLFLTTLCYVALRLLGLDADVKSCSAARAWLSGRRVTHIPTWGKMWLAMCGLYGWDGIHPVPPETWMLPRRFTPAATTATRA